MTHDDIPVPAGHEQELRADGLNTHAIHTIGEAGISLQGVTKRYGEKAVGDGIDLVIEPGEVMTFLGPSGSGKTTTLNMIAGFTQVSEGQLHIYGKPVAKLPPHKRDIGMVFQNYALFPHKTVAENIAYPLQRRKLSKAQQRERVAQALGMVRMSEYGERYPSELSGGQQQRVALARALVYQPRVLLMDEPLGALDKKLREWLQGEIKRIHREVGSTFVYVTHDQEEALSMSDRIAVFNNGRIEQLGTAEDLYEAPQTLFVGRFLGESTVLLGKGSAHGERQTVIELAGHRIVADGQSAHEDLAILIRPENLRLEAAGTAPRSEQNAIPVTITDVTYLGASRRYTVELPDGTEGAVRAGQDARIHNRGDRVTMMWDVSSGVLLVDTGEAGESTT
ncbi:ABC transporter ATP-binding protein [Leucobacter massiliensis]|uniref:Spermidine/putrescine import ATP-binding protein PotA n=1 Tax=Leucobacter massiliensis TaxID=1686285 RepID=A0A2S9QNG6_9MICO|nr:ABC transporter ATP-binding protein [Leucobacter massiliensis]PRI11100.1 spermidine/putrescine ABC transporter [Leucobacter massiliensis]